jgi:hypothetical protein
VSGILMLIYWVGIPVGVFLLARWLFRLAQSFVIKGLVVAGTVSFFAWFLWVAVGRNMWLDHQVREMCAKDGGVKVYETVELTPDLVDWAGRISIPFKERAKPTDKYYMEMEEHFFLKGDPQMTRSIYRILRRIDGKILGESVYYGRGGGDLPGPWHGSSFTCPNPAGGSPGLEILIFKGDKK